MQIKVYRIIPPPSSLKRGAGGELHTRFSTHPDPTTWVDPLYFVKRVILYL